MGTYAPARDIAPLMRTIAEQTIEMARDVRLLFVTNLQSDEMADVGSGGVLNTAQYYTREQADEIIYEFQRLGVSVESYFTERDFIAAVAGGGVSDDKHRIVFTTAEGGQGSGRRALIPALCNLFGLPVLNSGAHACSLARHKLHASAVLRQAGVRVPGIWMFRDGSWAGDGTGPPSGAKVILKPTYESMCIGVDRDSVHIVANDFENVAEEAAERFGQPVIVQEFVTGEEVGVPLIRIGKTQPLPPVAFRRRSGEPFEDQPRTFEDENLLDDVGYFPLDLASAQSNAIQDAAVRAFDSLEMKGVGRIDFRVDVDGRAWVIDTNESPPPMADTSYATAMNALEFSFEEMLAVWLGVCLFEAGLISGV